MSVYIICFSPWPSSLKDASRGLVRLRQWSQLHCASCDENGLKTAAHSRRSTGIKLVKEADELTEGPDSITLFDPDGNTILIDQHV